MTAVNFVSAAPDAGDGLSFSLADEHEFACLKRHQWSQPVSAIVGSDPEAAFRAATLILGQVAAPALEIVVDAPPCHDPTEFFLQLLAVVAPDDHIAHLARHAAGESSA